MCRLSSTRTVILTRFNTLSLNYRWCQCALSFSVLQWDWNLKRPFWHLYITVKKYFFLFTETSFILLTMLKNNFVRTILLQLCWLIYFCNGESEVAFTVFSVTGSFRNSDMLIVTLLSMVLPNIFVEKKYFRFLWWTVKSKSFIYFLLTSTFWTVVHLLIYKKMITQTDMQTDRKWIILATFFHRIFFIYLYFFC